MCLLFLLVFGTSEVGAQITANFTADTTKGCTPVTINFKDLSTGNNLRYLWVFGNGNVSTLQHPQAIYYQPGIYEVSLTINDTSGHQDTKTIKQYIHVFKSPKANFSGAPLSGCTPLASTFTHNSVRGDGKITSFIWDFGDGNTLKDSVGAHVYKAQGKFNVSLVVVDENACQDKKYIPQYVEALPSPVPAISAANRYYCVAPFAVDFNNTTAGLQSSDSYLWEFGDGSTSTQLNPSHTYTSKGSFNVTLTVTKANGCQGKKTFPAFVVIDDIKPDFVAESTKACAPAKIRFTNITQPTQKGVTFEWTFSDGSKQNGEEIVHEFKKSGTYDVTLKAVMDSKCQATSTKSAYIKIDDTPEALFTMSDSLACKIPKNIILTNKSTNSTSIEWFIDGKLESTQQIVAHQITTFGNHEIKLIASNFLGCTDTLIKMFRMEAPEVTIHPKSAEGCAPFNTSFQRNVKSFEAVTSYDWTFEPGKQESNSNETVSHTFQNPGNYDVILAVVTASGCKAADTVNIRVGLKTKPSFPAGKDTLCNNELDTFFSTSNATGVDVHSWTWKLVTDGDTSDFSSEENGVLKTKHPPATYGVMLITENNGCLDTFYEANKVTILAPLARIAQEDLLICNTDTLLRSNASMGEDSIIWEIYWPAGVLRETRNDSQLILTRKYNGHKLILYAFNSETGCMDTMENNLEFPSVTTRASLGMTGTLCAPSTLQFKASDDGIHAQTWYVNNDTLYGPDQTLEFPDPGDYTVKLVVENPASGCKDSTIYPFTVTGPEVSGELEGDDGCAPLKIKLTNNSSVSGFSELYWLIDTTKIPVTSVGTINHTLLKPGPENDGQYTIRLIGKDQNGCAGTQAFPIKVKGVIGADIKVRRITKCHGRHFIFEVIAPNHDIDKLGISWDFGDGRTSSTAVNNVEYAQDGNYNLVLKLTDTTGCVTEVRKVIDIEKERLHPDFTADSLETICPPLFVQFRDLSTTAPGRLITKWLWDFGDGSSSVERNPSKLYLFPGNYTVKLYLEDENKCSDSVTIKDFVLVSGPSGTFSFDKKQGCVPLDVKFTATAKDAVKTEFDMGDGTVYINQLNFTHTYKQAGRYIPVLVLTDSFGCTFTHPPIDTIYVYDLPKPQFVSNGVCFGKPIEFKAINGPNDGEIQEYKWEFIQGSTKQEFDDPNPVVTFTGKIKPIVRLTTTNIAGCSGTFEGEAELSNLIADFEPDTKFNCVGNLITVHSTVESDTTITSYKWLVGGQEFDTPSIQFLADQMGPQHILFIVTNALGCIDTLQTGKLVVGDTIPPLNIEILRVTVNDDQTVQLDLKPSTAPDFQCYEIYKDGLGGYQHLFNEYDQTKTSILNNLNNTLHNVYCFRADQRNACGVLSDSVQSIPHCTVECSAQSDTNRAVISWNRYAGWGQVRRYEILREDLESPGSFVPIGQTAFDTTTFIDSNIVCRVEHTYKIKAIEDSGNNQVSFSDTCKAQPLWTYRPDPNELVRASVVDDKFVTIDWDSVHGSRIPIKQYVVQRSDDGALYYLSWTFEPNEFNLEDKDVRVDDQSYFYRTFAIDQCNDTSAIQNFGKTILLKADTTHDQRPLLNWSTYQGWDAGVDFYIVEIKNPDGSFSYIGQTASTDTSLVDEITNLNQRPNYCYRIIGYRNDVPGKPQVVSISNEDCSPVHSQLYYPNAFTPNSDDLNEGFGTPGIYIVEYHMSIYTRWGEKIFETFDMDEKWDGTYQGEPAQQDVYAVVVESLGVDRIRRVHYGTITLLR
ncbi:MAG: PKD domain-containing protein [Flavobacteriales bacterium]|nr:PKD domain-containing protein [Flavobacteriales bacterium]